MLVCVSKMVRKMAFRARVFNISVVVGVGVGGWMLGTFTERKRPLLISDKFYDGMHETSSNFCFHKNFPALPLCGTVSAASPIENKVVSQPSILPASTRVSEIMRYGFPGLDNVRSFDDYILSYDRRTRVPHWVFEHLTKDKLKYNDAVDRSKCQFYEDESQHIFFRALNTDYKGSGFDRGHMAAAGNHRLHQKHVEQTFVLSNMAPQVGRGFNRDAWNRLEKYVRKLTKKYVNVYVCTGPLYLPRKESDGKTYVKYQVIGANTVAVPTHFFKVVVGEAEDRSLEMEAYVMPNQVIDDNTPLSVFQVPPESIERAAGLLFFDRVSRDKLSAVNGKKK